MLKRIGKIVLHQLGAGTGHESRAGVAGGILPPLDPHAGARDDGTTWFAHPRPAIEKEHDPDLGSALRGLVAKFGARRVMLDGPSLVGWYHAGSQLPWKRVVAAQVECATDELVQDAVLRTRDAVQPTNAPANVRQYIFAGERQVLVRIELVRRLEPGRCVQIDGTIARVPLDVASSIGRYYKTDDEADPSAMLHRLEVPRGWMWNNETGCFVRTTPMRFALSFPPNGETISLMVRTLLAFGLLYMLLVYMAPDLGSAASRVVSETCRMPARGPPLPPPPPPAEL